MSDKQRFQEITAGIRSDLKYFKESLQVLVNKIEEKGWKIDEETKNWIFDTFLDKLYEINVKIIKVLEDLGLEEFNLPMHPVKYYSQQVAFSETQANIKKFLDVVWSNFKNYEHTVESCMSQIRQNLHQTNWKNMEKVEAEDYVLPVERAKYVRARDELLKAKEAVKAKKWDEVLNHLRPAIDLAIKEKIGFKKIFPMKQFVSDAEKHNLPLPSYTMIYDYFDEGSHRIHEGKLNTPWECEKALSFVAEFIDRLDLVSISQEDINEFKRKSKAVS